MLFVQRRSYCILLLTSQPVFGFLYNTALELLHTIFFLPLCTHNIQSIFKNSSATESGTSSVQNKFFCPPVIRSIGLD